MSQTVGNIEVPVSAEELSAMRDEAKAAKLTAKQLAELGKRVVENAGMITIRGYINVPQAKFVEREDGSVVLKNVEAVEVNGGYITSGRLVMRTLDGYNVSFNVFSPRKGMMVGLNAILALSAEDDTRDRLLAVIRSGSDALMTEPTTEYTNNKTGKKGQRKTAAIDLPFVNSFGAQAIASYPRDRS